MPKGMERRRSGPSQPRGLTPFAIPWWVPLAAATVIEWHSTFPGVTDRDIALLERLATAEAMRDVWPKLTSVDAGEIVSMILRAEAAARGMRPPLPRRTKDLPAYLQEFPIVPGPGALAVLIEEAGAQLMQLEPETRALWPDLWPGQQDVTFDILMSILSDAAAFYRRFVAFVQEADAAAPPLPLPPRKRGAKKGRQTYFGLILSDYFKRIGGSPLDDVVSAITGVVFDDASGGPGSDKVRGRRRSARGRKADQT